MLKRLLMLSAVTAAVSASADMVVTVDCCMPANEKRSERCAKFVVSEESVVDLAAMAEQQGFTFGECEAVVSVDPTEDGVTVTLTVADHEEIAPQTIAWGKPAVFTCPETGATVRVVVEQQ